MSEINQITETGQATSNDISMQISNTIRSTKNVSIGFKLDGTNYPLWSRLMRVAIGGRGKSRFITGVPPPPSADDPQFYQWEEQDLTVFSWVIQNMEQKLLSNFAQHQTTKELWNSLSVTYECSTDPVQIYDLEVRANRVVQGANTLEDFWNELHGLWINMDRRQPNPVSCCENGINQHRKITENRRLFQFLAGLNDSYESIRRDIIKEIPSPSAEVAFSRVKREAARLQILKPATVTGGSCFEMSSSGVGSGLVAKHSARWNPSKPPSAPPRSGAPSSRDKEDKELLLCSHCGMRRHTKENCFEVVGYLEWWENNHKKPQPRSQRGKATLYAGDSVGKAAKMVGGVQAADTSPSGGRAKEAAGVEAARVMGIQEATVVGGRNELNPGYQDEEDNWTWH